MRTQRGFCEIKNQCTLRFEQSSKRMQKKFKKIGRKNLNYCYASKKLLLSFFSSTLFFNFMTQMGLRKVMLTQQLDRKL